MTRPSWKLQVLGAALASSLVLAGCELEDPEVTFTCTAVHFAAVKAVATVDNTGDGTEHVDLRVLDGDGHVLHDGTSVQMVGSSTIPDETYTYTMAPTANPLKLIISSPAGGDLAADTVWYTFEGRCAALDTPVATPTIAAIPTLGEWALLLLGALFAATGLARLRTRRH